MLVPPPDGEVAVESGHPTALCGRPWMRSEKGCSLVRSAGPTAAYSAAPASVCRSLRNPVAAPGAPLPRACLAHAMPLLANLRCARASPTCSPPLHRLRHTTANAPPVLLLLATVAAS